jgi:hypothetical protein
MLLLFFETNAVLQTRNETIDLKIYLKTLYRCRVFRIDVAVRKLAETLQIFKDVSCNKKKGKTLKKEKDSLSLSFFLLFILCLRSTILCVYPIRRLTFIMWSTIVFVLTQTHLPGHFYPQRILLSVFTFAEWQKLI